VTRKTKFDIVDDRKTTLPPIIPLRAPSSPPTGTATLPTTRTPLRPTSCFLPSLRGPARARFPTTSSMTEPPPWPRPAPCLSGEPPVITSLGPGL